MTWICIDPLWELIGPIQIHTVSPRMLKHNLLASLDSCKLRNLVYEIRCVLVEEALLTRVRLRERDRREREKLFL